MRIAASPVQQASLSRRAIWWQGDGHPAAFDWRGSAAGNGRGRADHRASGHNVGAHGSRPAIV